MTTKLHYYGSEFVLSDDHDDEGWRAIIQDRFDLAETNGKPLVSWFDLAGGGHVTLRIDGSTPLAVTTD